MSSMKSHGPWLRGLILSSKTVGKLYWVEAWQQVRMTDASSAQWRFLAGSSHHRNRSLNRSGEVITGDAGFNQKVLRPTL